MDKLFFIKKCFLLERNKWILVVEKQKKKKKKTKFLCVEVHADIYRRCGCLFWQVLKPPGSHVLGVGHISD
jgi:hypothetical protein